MDWKPDRQAGEEYAGWRAQDDEELSAEEIEFLEMFPKWKQQQEMVIAELYKLAHDADTAHQKFTKANVTANCFSVASGLVSVMGLALAPVTGGGSLILTAAGQGVGLTAGIINIVTDVWENSSTENTRTRFSHLVPSSDGAFQEDIGGEGAASYVRASGEVIYKCGSAFEVIRQNVRALRLANAYPHLLPAAKQLRTVGQVSGPVSRHVHKAFKNTALAMSQNALLKSGALAAVSLGWDAYSLWKKLQDKEGTELAKELRRQASELKEEISLNMKVYEALQEKKLFREERRKKSSSKGTKKAQAQHTSRNEKAGSSGREGKGPFQ
uniref:Apolipoprotein L6 n=1 Tax=Cavia porcellus TaxID=10141 RepID=H0W2L7_CAVPO|nr:apolipoprotein L6 [Cavia porcellus]